MTFDLRFENVSKKYRIRHEVEPNFSFGKLSQNFRGLFGSTEDFWALRDVSFDVERGEALGIIGHNGAGKSTILKLLSGITTPTSGRITINGRLAALIEVGSGFHPELTGRENIYLNGSILGMSRREITKKLDSIIEFAGVSQFIDTPVKRFSSGMYVRLGFSIAAHLEPDILLLDEVLAVGDASFQTKCLQKMSDLKRAGTTIVFISHDLAAVQATCDRALVIQAGSVVFDDSAKDGIEFYRTQVWPSTEKNITPVANDAGLARIHTAIVRGPNGTSLENALAGERVMVRVSFEVFEYLEDIVIDVLFYEPDGSAACELTTEISSDTLSLPPGKATIDFECSEVCLNDGIYFADIRIIRRGEIEALCFLSRAFALNVQGTPTDRGGFFQPHTWKLNLEDQLT